MKVDRILSQPSFETERFLMRPMSVADQGPVAFYLQDERVARMTTSTPHPLPPGAVEGLITRALKEDRESDIWVIDGRACDLSEVIGLVTILRLGERQAELSYWIAPLFWNKGVASEVVQGLVAQNPMSNSTIFASVFQDNPASARVLTNCGFDYVGDAEAFSVARNASVPTWTYLKTF